MTVPWQPDLLGEGFERTTVTLPLTWGTPATSAVATIVRALPTAWDERVGAFRHLTVLYVHGWSDSPWLELQLGALGREVLTPLVGTRALIAPLGQHPVVDLGFYTRAQREIGTLPDSPEGWRPERGFPTHPGWLAAIMEGHREIRAAVEVQTPVLVLLSARSSAPLVWNSEFTRTDSVLAVDEIAQRALRIAQTVTISWIEGAIHDVFLSREGPRQHAYDAVSAWLPTVGIRAGAPRA